MKFANHHTSEMLADVLPKLITAMHESGGTGNRTCFPKRKHAGGKGYHESDICLGRGMMTRNVKIIDAKFSAQIEQNGTVGANLQRGVVLKKL